MIAGDRFTKLSAEKLGLKSDKMAPFVRVTALRELGKLNND